MKSVYCNKAYRKWIIAIVLWVLAILFLTETSAASAQAVNRLTTIPAIQNTLSKAVSHQYQTGLTSSTLNSPVSASSAIDLTNSTVEFDPTVITDSNPSFYPNQTINLMALIEAQGTGEAYVNGNVKIFLNKDIFKPVSASDVSSSEFLRGQVTISETDTDYVINLPIGIVPSGAHIGIPFLATLKPGKIHHNQNYQIPSEYYDADNNLLFKTNKFAVHTVTDPPTASGPGKVDSLNESYWDNENKLKTPQKISINQDSSYYYDAKTEPGDYTFTVQLPTGYTVPDGGSGGWTYHPDTNQLIQQVTINTKSGLATNGSLGSFTLTIPAGYVAGTSTKLLMTVTGPNGEASATSKSVSIFKAPTPTNYFSITGSKRIAFGTGSWQSDVNKISTDTSIISTITPLSSMTVGKYGGHDTIDSAALASVTDIPQFDYPISQIAFNNTTSLSSDLKQKLDQNEIEGVYSENGISKTVNLGSVSFDDPLEINEANQRAYSSIKITFASPVQLSKAGTGQFSIKTTGHLTHATIDQFKESQSSSQSYYNRMSAQFSPSGSSVYTGTTSSSDYISLTKDMPSVGSPRLTLHGQNGTQMLGGKPLLVNFDLNAYNNGNDKILPQNGKVIYLVPDGVSLDSTDTGDIKNLKNLTVQKNYAGSGKTAIIGEITNAAVFGTSNGSVNYQIPLTADASVYSGSYNVEAFFVFTNNNGKAGNKTDLSVDENAARIPDQYGLYASTNNPKRIISNEASFTYLPDRKLVNANKVKVFNPETNQWSEPVSDTGDNAFTNDKLEYDNSIKNDGLSPYTYLDIIGVLPYPDDVKINGTRGSNVAIHLTGPISLDNDRYTVSYSTATPNKDLVKNYDAKFETTESDWSKATMIRIKSKTGTTLGIGDLINFTYPAQVPNISKEAPDANKAQGINTFIIRTSDNDVNLLESTPATVRVKQPYVPVSLQFWTKDQDGTAHQIKDPQTVTDQKIGSTFTKNAADYPVDHYVPADSSDHSIKVSRAANNNVLKLWYNPKSSDATVNGVVKFQDSAGNSLDKDISFSGVSGYRYDVTAISAVKAAQKKIQDDGYQLQSTVGDPKGIFIFEKPVTVIYKYEKPVTSPTPSPTPTPITGPNPNPITSPNLTPTLQPTSQPILNPNKSIAAKNEAVYALKKIYLYQKPTFKKSQRQAGYVSKPRVHRPMFVVTGYARSANGILRYKVRDVNHLTKNRHKTGYITARWAYIRPVYYQSTHKTLTVINPRGVNEYRAVNLTGKVHNFKQGQVLQVKKFVHHNLTTRYVLANGHYITGNRKLVQMGEKEFPKYVKAKTSINRYRTVNLTQKNKHYKKNKVFKVRAVDYSYENSVINHGTMRYKVAGGYITANAHLVKAVK
ncbi:hypothetical protein YK48G_18600 [Lentilactobacillus fungorum]|uniref:DUF5776 domain-containing protein n=1 Tax=Lentilactobacillus fungorum TaxID=2201250 RepID=A0ABQ3VZU6_9LACO|nr:DUF5776 domain-containing protein [Lentilactobacillus fungorum]GHP14435.1 hypothetical protein YK48G_18600 [Lentilactobacillus fungorum]